MKYLIANWKMNPAKEEEALEIAQKIEQETAGLSDLQTVICPPYPYLQSVRAVLQKAVLGSQDVSVYESGAYTGQVSAVQLADLKVKYCLAGHSERFLFAHEKTKDVKEKALRCLDQEIVPVVCLGSGSKPTDNDSAIKALLRRQFNDYFHGNYFEKLIIVYEPAWAISTAESHHAPSALHVAQMVEFIRGLAQREHVGDLPVLYGGSINSHNAGDYLSADGFLVGSASLDPDEFGKIARML